MERTCGWPSVGRLNRWLCRFRGVSQYRNTTLNHKSFCSLRSQLRSFGPSARSAGPAPGGETCGGTHGGVFAVGQFRPSLSVFELSWGGAMYFPVLRYSKYGLESTSLRQWKLSAVRHRKVFSRTVESMLLHSSCLTVGLVLLIHSSWSK